MLKKKTTVTNGSLQMEFDRIPESAKDVVRTIDSSKKLFRYVKKVDSQKNAFYFYILWFLSL